MAEKTLGYSELEWTCPNCKTRNKGSVKICTACGAAQPENVEFQQPVQQEIVQDLQKIDAAKAGADIHCGYCGVRNPAGAAICSNCGGDLTAGKQRQVGRVVGAYKDDEAAPVICPSCGESNPPANLKCSRCGTPLLSAQPQLPSPPAPTPTKPFPVAILIAVLVVGAIICVFAASLFFRTSNKSASVTNREWQRSVVIEQFGPVNRDDWRSDIPSEGKILSCSEKQRSTSSDPVSGAREVCGTPYTVDQGSGYGKVVQDCIYEIYDDYCSYQINDWSRLNEQVVEGVNDNPAWPDVQLQDNQRTGNQSETYRIIFEVNGGNKTYHTTDASAYQQAVIGSHWILTINGLGEIVRIAPSQ
jgi:ribosomal protein L40E